MAEIPYHIKKEIEHTAELLPYAEYISHEYRDLTGAEAKLCGSTEIEGKAIEDDAMYTIRIPVFMPVNHERRLRRIYQRNIKISFEKASEEMLQYCMKQVDEHEQRVKQNEGK